MTLANPQDWEKPDGWFGGLHWGVAALVVVSLHAAGAWFFVQMPPVAAPPQGVPEAPILIDLAPPEQSAPAAPAVEAPPTEAEPEPAPPEPTAEPEPLPEPVTPPPPEPPPPEPAPPEPVVPPEPEPLPPEPVVPEPVVPEPPEPLPPEPVIPEPPPEVLPPVLPVTEQQADAVINAPVPRARPAPPRPPERAVTERRRPPPERRETPVRREARPRVERKTAPPPSRASTAKAAAEASQGAKSRVSANDEQRWRAQINARVRRFRRSVQGSGTAQVTFRVTTSGAATGIRLSSSSGNAIVDQAAVSVIQRASPFPPHPDGEATNVTIPFNYK
ncbi:energy transducer TonB family protein [Aureimonas pseudogalii]|uniref:Protein TonB n=1 Tax=Aureimonas pseudogalii TaxID=1744844 RepID=A0A7W6H284_9HYPH|nr:energy transducer TonB [Aureimonas pseudogalii]MBB3996766.1 protein TonB [Aureimonas pseudogalii]